MAGFTNRNGVISDINVTPLVDVVLVLLVLLMTTTSYIVSRSIPVDLPKGATGQSNQPTLTVSVDASGVMYVDARAIDVTALRRAVREAKKSDADPRAVIAADGRTAHRFVVRVIDVLRQEGLHRFAINVDPGDLSEK